MHTSIAQQQQQGDNIMLYIKFKKYVRRVCIHKNNTLNSQITYWNGQKTWLDWRTRIFGEQMKIITHKFWGLQSRDRYGLGMKWSNRPRKRVGWGICIRLNSPPPLPKIDNIFSMIYLWTWIWKFGRDLRNNINKHTSCIARWFLYHSYINSIKPTNLLHCPPIANIGLGSSKYAKSQT